MDKGASLWQENKSILKLIAKQDEHSDGPVSDRPEPLLVTEIFAPEQLERIRGISLLEFSNAYYLDVRFQNVMLASLTEGAMPYETVGA